MIYHMDPGIRKPGGVYKESLVIDATGVPCRMSAFALRQPKEFAAAGQFAPQLEWIVLFRAGRDIPDNARFIITGATRDIAWTKHLEVISQIIKDTEMWRHVACSELERAKWPVL